MHLLVRSLDSETRESWAIHQENNEEFSTYKELVSFIEHRIHSLEEAGNKNLADPVKKSNLEHKQNKSNSSKSTVSHVAHNPKNKKSFSPC